MPDKTAIDAKVNYSNLGSVNAEVKGTLAYGNDIEQKATSISVGYKKSGVTAIADSSESVGVKVEHNSQVKKDKGFSYRDSKYIVDLTQLHTNDYTMKVNNINAVESKNFRNKKNF